MGNKFVALSNTNSLKCSTDADCYVAFATSGVAAATTAADKAKRCCYFYGIRNAPIGTGKATGDAFLLAAKTAYGVQNTLENILIIVFSITQPSSPASSTHLLVNTIK